MLPLIRFLSPVLIVACLTLVGCKQSADLSSAGLQESHPALGAALNPDAYMEVDCLLPGQVRKLGTMVYVSPRRPAKTTANDCTIRGGEYVVFDRSNYKESLAVWMVEAETGDPVAQTYVGEIYLKSPPGAPRFDLAAKWFERAANNGFKRAQVNLGYLYENGLGVRVDPNKAAKWYSKASGSKVQNIVQQQQFSPEQRAELQHLKQTNADQQLELTTIRQENETLTASLVRTEKELRTSRVAISQKEEAIALQKSKMRRVKEQIAKKKDVNVSVQQAAVHNSLLEKLAELKAGLEVKEGELARQKELTSDLSKEVVKQKENAQKNRQQLASMNKRLENLPGPKIEVFDPQLLRTRGITIAPVKKDNEQRMITGKVWAPAGLKTLTVNGINASIDKEGRFKNLLKTGGAKTGVVITAVDLNGRSEEVEFILEKNDFRASALNDSSVLSGRDSPNISFGRYYALVIGNNNYRELPKLKTAVEDAKVVGELLKKIYGFEVQVLLNANRNTILSTLNDYRKKLTEKDNFLIYYAGHGTLEERNTQGFWLPVDSSLDDDVNWIPTDRVTGIMNLMSAKQIMVVADACYSGIMTRASLTRLETGKSKEAYSKWLKKMAAYKSRVIISSGETKPVLDGGGGKHSVFAKALVDTLRDNDKILLGIDLHRAIAEKVVDASGRIGLDQVPQYAGLNRAGHELGDFLFVPKKRQG